MITNGLLANDTSGIIQISNVDGQGLSNSGLLQNYHLNHIENAASAGFINLNGHVENYDSIIINGVGEGNGL